jgi:hypothetical protein
MSEEERAKNPHAERLLLMSKPSNLSGEWTNKKHFIGEILTLNDAMKELKPLLKKKSHMEVIDTKVPEVLFLSISEPGNDDEILAVIANLDLEKEKTIKFKDDVVKYYLNRPSVSPEEGKDGEIKLLPGGVTVFTYEE